MSKNTKELTNIEECLIGGKDYTLSNSSGILEQSDVLRNFVQGKYVGVLQTSTAKDIFSQNLQGGTDLYQIIEDNVQRQMDQSDDRNRRSLEILAIGAACLQLFVQNNWMGPLCELEVKDLLSQELTAPGKYESLQEWIQGELSCDGVSVYNLCIGLEYLYLARCILLNCRQHLTSLQTSEWWLMHCLSIHQQMLDEKSPTLKETLMELIDNLSNKEPLMTSDQNRGLAIQFHLEAGYLCYSYYEYKKAKEHFHTARKLSQLEIELTGAMGKRTRFQQDEKAQLVLRVKREKTTEEHLQNPSKTELPKMVKLEDEAVLEEIQFSDETEQFAPNLTALEQAVLIGVMEDHLKSQASQERLTEEEAMAYIECVLSQAKCWSVTVAALAKRSALQKGQRRTVERSMMQLEELVNQITRTEPPAQDRLYLFYSLRIQPVWIIQKQLADLLLGLGAVGHAVEVFERLEMWEDVIRCYQRLGKMEKAESLIRQQLAVKETANLWCFLGDVSRDMSHYEKAWEMSNHRHARAQRCMGYLYFGQEDYKKSMECFEKSLSINSLQIPVWFTYGCTCLAAQEFEKAVKAFKRCVNLDSDNFEAWNNLALAYTKLKDKPKAFLTLKESIKCNYENWRVWENLLIVSTDVGEFEEAIHSYHRLMDLKDKWVDDKVLEVLVRGTSGDYMDAQGLPSQRHRQKLLELFGRVTAKVTTNGKIWNLYAQLTSTSKDQTPDVQQKVLQYLQKSHRCVTQDAHWQQDVNKCEEVGRESVQLADTYLKCSEKASSNEQAVQMMSSAKLMLKGVISKIKQEHTDPVTETLNSSVVTLMETLDSKLTEITEKFTELKGS